MRGVRWIGSARLFTQVVTLSLTAFTVRLLEPKDYGLVATSGLFTVFAEMLLDGGLVAVLLSRRELPRELQGAALSAVLLLGVLLSAAVIAVSPLAGMFFKSSSLVHLMWLASLQLPLSASTMVPLVRLLKEMRFRQLAVAQSAGSLVQGLTTLALAYHGEAYWSLILGTLTGTIVRSSLLWISVEKRPTPNLRLGLLVPLWAQGGQMLIQRVVWFVIGNLDTFLLGRLGGPTVLGSYSLAKNLSHSPLDQLAGVVNQVSMTAFAAKAGDTDAQSRGLLLIVSVISALVFPFFWVGGVLSQVAFPLIFGGRWTSLVAPFVAFTCVLPARCIYALLDASVMGMGRFSTTLKNALTWAVILIPLLLVGVWYGALGEALAWTIGFPVVLGFALWRIASAMSMRTRELVRPMVRPALCALASAALVEALIMELRGRQHPALQLAMEIAVGGASYVLLLRTAARAQYLQAVDLIGRLVRR
jgi:O-antigen/teichoic acid export membrane protein